MLMAFHARKILELLCDNSELEVRFRRRPAVQLAFVLDRNHGRIKSSFKFRLNDLLHTGLTLHDMVYPVLYLHKPNTAEC